MTDSLIRLFQAASFVGWQVSAQVMNPLGASPELVVTVTSDVHSVTASVPIPSGLYAEYDFSVLWQTCCQDAFERMRTWYRTRNTDPQFSEG